MVLKLIKQSFRNLNTSFLCLFVPESEKEMEFSLADPTSKDYFSATNNFIY